MRVLKENKWKPAIVEAKTNHPRSYIVQTDDGKELRRNRVHIHSNDKRDPIYLSDDDNSDDGIETMQKQHTQNNVENKEVYNETDGNSVDKDETNKNSVKTRSGRIVKRPSYLKDYV